MSILISLLLLVSQPPLPDPCERISFLSSRGFPAREPWVAQEGTDFLTYDIDISISPESCSISGAVLMTLVLEQNLDTLIVDLCSSMEVEEVDLETEQTAFSHDNDRLFVPLSASTGAGDTLSIKVSYGGNPTPLGFGSFICTTREGEPQFWTLSQTDYAHTWWPCHDTPRDKALVSMVVTVPYSPDSFFVAGNGVLEQTEYVDGLTTYFWREIHPIPPYLVSLAGTNYVTLMDNQISVTGDTIPIRYWVYPELLEDAREDFSLTTNMISAFEKSYGPYPFQGEKYAMALVRRSGAMEHQTVTSYGDEHILGDHHFDWIVAHELAHQWWGDWVTCGSWDHIWLNEGFASFSEALWAEHTGGEEAYRAYMLSQDYLLTSGNEFPGTVLYPDQTFSISVYDKGAWIVHMLRKLLGEETFWASLKRYGQTHSHSIAFTSDLVAACEEESNRELQWFFDQWLLREGRPHLELSWEKTSTFAGDSVSVKIDQVQIDEPYRLPMELRFIGTDSDTIVVVDLETMSEEFDFFLLFQVNDWEVDPNDNLLIMTDNGPGEPEEKTPTLFFYPPRPNPSRDFVSVGIDVPWSLQARLSVFDLLGRSVWQGRQNNLAPGWSTLTWEGLLNNGASAPSGLYLVKIQVENQTALFPLVRVP